MIKNKVLFTILCLLGGLLWFSLMSVDLAQARLGRGRSFGFRGSRSYSAPRSTFSRPRPTPSPRTRPGAQTRPGPTTSSRQSATSGFGRGLAGGIAGGLLGGMLGSMLFGGRGYAGGGMYGGGSSFGLLDLALIAGLLYLGYRLFFWRRQDIPGSPASASPVPMPGPSNFRESDFAALRAETEVGPDLSLIRAHDPQFDEMAFKERAQNVFFKLQGAWTRQEPSLIEDLVTPELLQALRQDLAEMRAKGQVNRLENIAIRQVEISEVWQEAGQDFLTVGFQANLLDYVVDNKTGQIIAGSDTEPVKFEEYWTFIRPLGGDSWKLSAIQQA